MDRFAPAPYVEGSLAQDSLRRGRLDEAEHYALRLPAGSVRDGLLARVAAARGETVLAFEYAFAAPDFDAVQNAVAQLRRQRPEDAYRLEERFRDRIVSLQTHPDAVARAWWTLGDIAASMPGVWQARAYDDFAMAAQLAPLDMQDQLAAANEAVTLGRWNDAERAYRHAIDVDPGNGDARAGLGIVALESRHERAAALAQLKAARALDPSSKLAQSLARKLRVRP